MAASSDSTGPRTARPPGAPAPLSGSACTGIALTTSAGDHVVARSLFHFAGYGSLAPYDPDRVADNVVDMELVRWRQAAHPSAWVDPADRSVPS